ncbi:MAG: hypothetical protein ACOY4Q_11745 [Bacillota bacterium]
MKNIPLLQHEGIKVNYTNVSKQPENSKTPYPLIEKINSSTISLQDKRELTEMVRSMPHELFHGDAEAFYKHIEYLIRLKEARSNE